MTRQAAAGRRSLSQAGVWSRSRPIRLTGVVVMTTFSVLGAATGVLAASGSAGPETILLDFLPGQKPNPVLQHRRHTLEYRKPGQTPMVCRDCHHTLTTPQPAPGEAVKSCSSCHRRPDGQEQDPAPTTAPPLAISKGPGQEFGSVLFHQACRQGCHRSMAAEGKHLTGCKTCHAK